MRIELKPLKENKIPFARSLRGTDSLVLTRLSRLIIGALKEVLIVLRLFQQNPHIVTPFENLLILESLQEKSMCIFQFEDFFACQDFVDNNSLWQQLQLPDITALMAES